MDGYLLDVNILIALLDIDHEHHAIVAQWMENNHQQGWASCPITLNGCIRIMSHGSYSHGQLSVSEVVDKLRDATSTEHHSHIPDNINLLDSNNIDWRFIQNPNDITDVYLLTLATHNNRRLLTLDRNMNINAFRSISDDAFMVLKGGLVGLASRT